MTGGQPETDRAAEVEQVHHEPLEAQPVDETLDHLGEGVEGVGRVSRGLGVTEARVVGGDQVVPGAGLDGPHLLEAMNRRARRGFARASHQ